MDARHGERRPADREPASWTARILALVALVIVAVAVVIVVSEFESDDDDGGRGDRRQASTNDCQPDAENAVEAGYYVIEVGEDLSVVADRTCIPIERLIRLNENLDPQLIQVGSCVDLRFEGCKALAEG